MHIGHFASHFRMSTGCTITNNLMRRLLQTGITMWLRGFASSVLQPCCELSLIGGDGTFIGIPTENIPKSAQPVWEPQTLRNPIISWDCKTRQPLAKAFEDYGLGDSDAQELLELLNEMISATNSESMRLTFAETLKTCDVLQTTTPEVVIELSRWLHMSSLYSEYNPLRTIFSCIFGKYSITGLFPPQLTTTILSVQTELTCSAKCRRCVERLSIEYPFNGCGLGAEICQLFIAQLASQNIVKHTTVNMIVYFAKLSSNMYKFIESTVSKTPAATLLEDWNQRPNPETTGIRYFATAHGRSFRNSWPLPKTAISRLNHTEVSCSGCTKRRSVFIGHRQRSGIWLNLCMVHEQVVGFHLIHNQEGRRDALIPIYRFWETPPLAVWNDFGCGCEESGLNWLPEFFHGVQHFHDMFHGYSHTSCTEKFFSRRLPAFSSFNTSLMEQVSPFNLVAISSHWLFPFFRSTLTFSHCESSSNHIQPRYVSGTIIEEKEAKTEQTN
jgi:hypothetical protein